MTRILTPFLKIINSLLSFIYPPRCLSCDAFVETHGTLCFACFKKIDWITLPLCRICGRPLSFDLEDEIFCLSCQKKKRPYARARALFVYNDAAKPMVLRLKHGDGTYIFKPLARRAVKQYPDLFADADFAVPVPLHYTRLVFRRYNQSLILCRALFPDKAKVNPFLLKRIRRTKSQGHMNKNERFKNVKGAFSVPKQYLPLVKGKKILLVDDIMTTGATVEEASKAFLKAGVKSVEVFVLGVV